jgi:5-methylcytosine-specific restriction enzyme A
MAAARALSVCAFKGCPTLVPGGYCSAHRKPLWSGDGQAVRISGRRLQRLRKALFDRQPLCVECQRQGRLSIATIRDHVIPLAEGGQDIESNTQPLCQSCSDAKTARESARGRRRAEW